MSGNRPRPGGSRAARSRDHPRELGAGGFPGRPRPSGGAGQAGARARWEAPGPGHPERLALPRHLEAAARALFDELPEPLAAGVVDGAAAALTAGAEALVGGLPPSTELVVDGYRVRTAAGCPAALASEAAAPFVWSPATAARTLGLRAVAYHLRGDAAAADRQDRPGVQVRGRTVESAVDAVVADLVAEGRERSPGPWLSELPAPARAVAVAQARRWAEQALAWLPLRLVGERELRFLQDDWWPPRTPWPRRGEAGRAAGPVRAGGRTLVVHGRRDITVDVAGRKVAVSLAGGTASGPGLADVDALTALAGVLCDTRGRLVRVVRVHPASGEVVAVDVTPALLRHGVAVVLATARSLADRAAGREPPTAPGPACAWCDRREGCQPGTAWLQRPDQRSMGLPLLERRV